MDQPKNQPKYPILCDLLDAYRSGEENRVKKALEEISAMKEQEWTESEQLLINYVMSVASKQEKPLVDSLTRQTLSIEDWSKVSINYIKRKPTGTRCSTPFL